LPTGRWLLLLGATGILIVALSISLIQFTGIANSQTPNDADSTPCPTPILMEGKATGSASPAASATATSCVFAGKKPGIGTPVAVEGLQVNLHTDADYAGPVTLTVDVSAKDGAPVEGALVVVTTRSLEMNMGEFPHRADETDPGRYVADQVGMGMGGDWEIEVDVTVPGHPTAVAFFTVSLEGPM
jgi:hypothetical protein